MGLVVSNSKLDNCDIYRVCGAYGVCNTETTPSWIISSLLPVGMAGTFRRTPLNCQEGDGSLMYSGIKLPDTEHSLFNTTMGLQECENACATNCS